MFKRHRAAMLRLAGSACVLLLLAGGRPANAADAMLYRIFLQDGSTVVSYGEFARVADRVVFSIPLSAAESAAPQLQLVSISQSSVDWERTDRYAEAARARQYADTRGESDFALLSAEVARTLNDVALTQDPARRLALADQARRILAEWPARNYGYRASDVAQLSSLLDGVVSELRVAAGQSRFDLSLVATTMPPVADLLPPPTLRESIEQAFKLASLTPEADGRATLLRAISDVLSGPAASGSWVGNLRARALTDLAAEQRTDRAYAELSARTLASAEDRAKRADIKGIESLVAQVLKVDDRLGRRRPQATGALLATLDARIDAARRLRLARDAWSVRLSALRAYQRRVKSSIDQLTAARNWLEQIRHMSGPSAKNLPRLEDRASIASRELALVKAPPELEAVHGMLASALRLAIRAADARGRAITKNDMTIAWEASSAAAGALMLLDRACEEMLRLAALPEL